MRKQNRLVAWYTRFADFTIEDLFSRKRPAGPPRTVFVHKNLPSDYLDQRGRVKPQYVYTSNQVITSKYTVVTFLPRNLLEQFRRIANLFFLFLAIVQFFPQFSTISPGVVILPLVIIVTLTALKDGYEDYKRHQADRHVNHSTLRVLTGGRFVNPNMNESKSRTFIRGLVSSIKPRLVVTPSQYKLSEKPNASKVSLLASVVPDAEYDYDGAKSGGPHWKKTMWEDIKVGDIVKLMENESIPSDILICATSDEDNLAYVETKNLDGETNLKSRNAVPALTHLRDAAACADPANSFHVNCDPPENNMYRLNAAVTDKEGTHSADLQTVLLRGTVLRNTSWVIGVVLYTGEDTKIVMNAGVTPSKRSRVERQMNPQVIVNLIIMAILATVCAIADSELEKYYYPLGAPWMFAADRGDDNPRVNGAITWVYGVLAFQGIVPISLYLSIEVVRTLQAAFIYFDRDIYYEKAKQPTIARSWNLADDLGQIEYVFSDKTGTLTQNWMIFRQCSIGGKAYYGDQEDERDEDGVLVDSRKQAQSLNSSGASSSNAGSAKGETYKFTDAILQDDLDAAHDENRSAEANAQARALNGFFNVLALCHSVISETDPETNVIKYKAQSPDEAALVQAAADMGFVFLNRDHGILSLRTPSSEEVERYELLNILEFTSARKRMSVVLKKLGTDDNRIFLLSKGADNVIFDRLKPGNEDLKQATEHHLSEFANNGLRTLTLAYKVISEEDYARWIERYHDATVSLEDREDKIEAVSDELEQDLRLLGATAIEDRLQDGVPETIADLKKAGIKIWVATGDKLETAIAIGRSTNLIAPDSNIIILRGGSRRPLDQQIQQSFRQFFPENVDTKLHEIPRRPSMDSRPSLHRVDTGLDSIVGSQNGERPGAFILVVDGAALLEIFKTEEMKEEMLKLAMLCEGVICCRVSPLQKALIVRLVKDGLGAMTLAIGDGANDVSMIQAADVGVGISGEEGMQAVNSSDYAIAQFRFLKKLLLVHGHWSYARNGIMIVNFFYKNIVPTFVCWWFQIYCGWSASFGFDYIYILFWNSFWTIAPVVAIGLFDRILDYHLLMDIPELYHYGREQYWFGFRDFFIFMFDGIYQSVIIFFMIAYTYASTSARSDGYDVTHVEWGSIIAVFAVTTVNLYTGMSASAWTWWMVFGVFVGIVIVWCFTAIYNAISPGYAVTRLFGNNYFLFTSAYFWLLLPLTVILSLTPRYLWKAYQSIFVPTDIQIIKYLKRSQPDRSFANDSQTHLGIGLSEMKRHQRRSSVMTTTSARAESRAESLMTLERPSTAMARNASRTDMSTGIVSRERGFDFATEEHGAVMRRIQSHLSDKRIASNPSLAAVQEGSSSGGTLRQKFSLRRGFRRMGGTGQKSPLGGGGKDSSESP